MKVKAKHWIKTETGWHKTGDIFDVESLDGLSGMVEVIEKPAETKPVEEEHPVSAEAPLQKPARRTRKQK